MEVSYRVILILIIKMVRIKDGLNDVCCLQL
jgi:hypothetical protein